MPDQRYLELITANLKSEQLSLQLQLEKLINESDVTSIDNTIFTLKRLNEINDTLILWSRILTPQQEVITEEKK